MTTENTTTTTEKVKEPLMVTVPWAVTDKETGSLELTGNVSDRYVIAALVQRVKELEKQVVELTEKLKEQKVDTSTSDTPA